MTNSAENKRVDREDIFDALFAVIESRRQGDPERSYVASLLTGGPQAVGRKVVEEAAELVEAAVGEGPDRVVHECCDLLFHSFVLAAAAGVGLDDLRAELTRRFGVSGLGEKRARRGGSTGDE